MSAPQFTPGPWEAHGEGYSAKVFAPRGLLADPTGHPNEREANANLIAAAPRMYDMLERALIWIGGYGHERAEKVSQVEALLAEARGEQVQP